MSERDLAKLRLVITDSEELNRATDLLHDALFDFADIEYDETRQLFHARVWREVPELARHKRVVPFVCRIDSPRVRCVLEFSSVRNALIERTDEAITGRYCLTDLHFDPKRMCIDMLVSGPLKVQLTVDRLSATVKDEGEPTWDAPSIPTFVPCLRRHHPSLTGQDDHRP